MATTVFLLPMRVPGRGRIPAIHGAIRLGQSLALPESRKAV